MSSPGVAHDGDRDGVRDQYIGGGGTHEQGMSQLVPRGTHIPAAVGPPRPYFVEVCPDCGEDKYIVVPRPEQDGNAPTSTPSECLMRAYVRVRKFAPCGAVAAAAGQ